MLVPTCGSCGGSAEKSGELFFKFFPNVLGKLLKKLIVVRSPFEEITVVCARMYLAFILTPKNRHDLILVALPC